MTYTLILFANLYESELVTIYVPTDRLTGIDFAQFEEIENLTTHYNKPSPKSTLAELDAVVTRLWNNTHEYKPGMIVDHVYEFTIWGDDGP